MVRRKIENAVRDDFPEHVKRAAASRAGHRCSNPSCRAPTSGPQDDAAKAVSLGEAAHITAASPEGPRYNAAISQDDRRHILNAIWLCRNCARLVDNDVIRFGESILRVWKFEAERRARFEVGRPEGAILLRDPTLSDIQYDLLTAAGNADGFLYEHRFDNLGTRAVFAGNRYFVDPADPAVGAAYHDGLKLLCRFALAEHWDGNAYQLTATGFEIARELIVHFSRSA